MAESTAKPAAAKPAATKAEVVADKPAAKRVEAEAPGTKDVGAGTSAGEQIAGTGAKGVAAPEGGTVPEATPNDLPEVADTGAGVEEVKDGATNQPEPGSAPSLAEPMADTTADGGGTQAGGKTALPAQKLRADSDKIADSAEGAKGAPTAEQAAQHEGTTRLHMSGELNPDNESPRRAIAENTPAVPALLRVSDGLAEELAADVTDTKASTVSFASRSRQAPIRQTATADTE
jgi:hypothetical protein